MSDVVEVLHFVGENAPETFDGLAKEQTVRALDCVDAMCSCGLASLGQIILANFLLAFMSSPSHLASPHLLAKFGEVCLCACARTRRWRRVAWTAGLGVRR